MSQEKRQKENSPDDESRRVNRRKKPDKDAARIAQRRRKGRAEGRVEKQGRKESEELDPQNDPPRLRSPPSPPTK
jgi:hypothetical protein